eukprot:m.664939 g.664939  ORF g.664939 m.664939 type:complete len:644 (+) comp58490_c0_seq60:1717-3648(+)
MAEAEDTKQQLLATLRAAFTADKTVAKHLLYGRLTSAAIPEDSQLSVLAQSTQAMSSDALSDDVILSVNQPQISSEPKNATEARLDLASRNRKIISRATKPENVSKIKGKPVFWHGDPSSASLIGAGPDAFSRGSSMNRSRLPTDSSSTTANSSTGSTTSKLLGPPHRGSMTSVVPNRSLTSPPFLTTIASGSPRSSTQSPAIDRAGSLVKGETPIANSSPIGERPSPVPPTDPPGDQAASEFPRREGPYPVADPTQPSGLVHWVKTSTTSDDTLNPFTDFAKVGSETPPASGRPCRKLEIYYFFAATLLERKTPVKVFISGNPTVKDALGYILYLYAKLGKQPPLKGSVAAYKLFLHDENGEPFSDFPPLDEREKLSKFEFDVLVVCENEGFKEREKAAASTATEAKDNIITVIYNLYRPATVSQNAYDSSATTVMRNAKMFLKDHLSMRAIVQQAIKVLNCRHANEYGIQKADQPNIDLDLDLNIKEVPRPYTFLMYRKFARKAPETVSLRSFSFPERIEFTIYQSKNKANAVEVHLEPDRLVLTSKRPKHLLIRGGKSVFLLCFLGSISGSSIAISDLSHPQAAIPLEELSCQWSGERQFKLDGLDYECPTLDETKEIVREIEQRVEFVTKTRGGRGARA